MSTISDEQPEVVESDNVVEVQDFPYMFAKRNGVVLDHDEKGERIAFFRTKLTPSVANEVCRFLGEKITFKPLDNQAFDSLLGQHYDRGGAGARAMMDDLGDEFDLNDIADSMPEPEDLLEAEDDAPSIRLINALLSQAIKEGASDIQVETYENRRLIRMRVDGTLREVLEPPRAMAPLIVSRLKVMAKLDIAEKRVPQDGRISLKLAGRPVDVRVSTLPSGYNERIVLRLLDKQAGRLNLKHLGMDAGTENRLKAMIQKPHGIILVTGPTGSGKTTTLYAALADLNQTSRNILTVEDPIEYYLDGIGQTPDAHRALRRLPRPDIRRRVRAYSARHASQSGGPAGLRSMYEPDERLPAPAGRRDATATHGPPR